jgi:DNA repair protein RadC
MNVKLTEAQKISILNSADVYKVMQQVLLRENKIRRSQEHFWVVGLDRKQKILFIELVSLGATNRLSIAPPEVFRMGIYKLAVSMIMVHNHPSGNVKPSAEDMDTTDRMIKSGKMLNIQVIDHLIISDTEYLSFEDKGLMNKLRKSGAYELVAKEKAELKKVQLDEEHKKGREVEKIEMAKKMLRDKLSIDIIRKYTGLTKKDIEALKK